MYSIHIPDSSAAPLHDSIKKIFCPLFSATSKTHSVVNFLRKTLMGLPRLEADRNNMVRIHFQRAEQTPGWKAGGINDASVGFYNIIHRFLQLCVLA